MMKIFLRSLFITVPRFFAITALVTSLLYFDPSPLPEAATIIALTYIIHVGLTVLFAMWVFHGGTPTWGEAGMAAGVFIVFGTALEAGLSAFITKNSFWASFTNYNWQSLLIVLLYIGSVFAAAWYARYHGKKNVRPTGMA